MAKKTKKPSDNVTLTAKDKKTLGSIRDLADGVVKSADNGRAPYVEVPSRSLSNVRFNNCRKIIEMGEPAVPLLLRELEKSSGLWFEALRKITGKDPGPQEASGNYARMREAWLAQRLAELPAGDRETLRAASAVIDRLVAS